MERKYGSRRPTEAQEHAAKALALEKRTTRVANAYYRFIYSNIYAKIA